MRRTITGMAAMAMMMAIAGCAGYADHMGVQTPGGPIALAPLKNSNGIAVGRASAREAAGGLRITIDATGMPPGTHGAHVHTTGRCDAPGFMTAGGHWNPTGTMHGTLNPAGPHQGDLPNLVIGADGRGTLGITIPGATLAGLLEGDGSAIIIHEKIDDLMTDPSGNSGGRIACGVFAAG